jgi:Putative adhesin
MKLLSLIPAAILAAAIPLLATPASADEITKTFPVNGHARLHVTTDDGAIRISTGDIHQIEVRVVYSGYKLDHDLRVSATQNGDTVDVQAKTSGSMFSWGVHHTNLRVEIHMPKDTDLEATAGDGSIEADDLNGSVDARAGDGSITIIGGKGNIRLHTGDGHIEARNLDGNVDASAGDGSIRLEGRFDVVNVRTGDGSSEVRARPGSRVASSWNLKAGDGSIDVSLPADMQANIDASSHDGHISLGISLTVEGTFNSDNSHISGKMNGGGQPIVLRTGDGSIHLNKS